MTDLQENVLKKLYSNSNIYNLYAYIDTNQIVECKTYTTIDR